MQRWRRSPTTEAYNVFFFFPRSQSSTLAICLDFGGAFPNYSLRLCNLLLVGSHGRILCCKQSSDVSLGFSFCMEFLGEFWSIINKTRGGTVQRKQNLRQIRVWESIEKDAGVGWWCRFHSSGTNSDPRSGAQKPHERWPLWWSASQDTEPAETECKQILSSIAASYPGTSHMQTFPLPPNILTPSHCLHVFLFCRCLLFSWVLELWLQGPFQSWATVNLFMRGIREKFMWVDFYYCCSWGVFTILLCAWCAHGCCA